MGRHRRRHRFRRNLTAVLRPYRTLAEQTAYIGLCERMLGSLSDERDRLLRQSWANGSEDSTVTIPAPEMTKTVLEPASSVQILLPDGRVFRTVPGRRRPSWASD